MASVTDTGAVATLLATFRDRINAIWRSVYGEDLDTDTQTAPGQFAGLFAQALTEVSEAIVRVANMLNLDSAKKGQLDNLVSLLLIEREEGTNSVATVTFTGTPAVVIPAGTVVRSDQGDSFATGTAATIGAAPLGQTEGTVDVQVTAIATGPVPVDAGTIIRLAEGIAGVTAVTNANAGAVGSAGETDTALNRRYRDSLSRFAQGHLDAIRSAFVRQASVDRVAVADNATDATAAVQGLDITAHTTAGVVIWADGVTGSRTLFDAIMDTVHAPGLAAAVRGELRARHGDPGGGGWDLGVGGGGRPGGDQRPCGDAQPGRRDHHPGPAVSGEARGDAARRGRRGRHRHHDHAAGRIGRDGQVQPHRNRRRPTQRAHRGDRHLMAEQDLVVLTDEQRALFRSYAEQEANTNAGLVQQMRKLSVRSVPDLYEKLAVCWKVVAEELKPPRMP